MAGLLLSEAGLSRLSKLGYMLLELVTLTRANMNAAPGKQDAYFG